MLCYTEAVRIAERELKASCEFVRAQRARLIALLKFLTFFLYVLLHAKYVLRTERSNMRWFNIVTKLMHAHINRVNGFFF